MKQFSIKLFADGANKNSMLDLASKEWISGLTTNPSLMRAAGVTNYKEFALDVLKDIQKPISFEVFSDDFDEMEKQAIEIASWAPNVYVKIPITNTKGESSIPLIQNLSHRGIKINVTAVFTIKQVYEAAQALKGGTPSIVSIFCGRIADTLEDPKIIAKEAVKICQETDKNIEVLWASPRQLLDIKSAEECGCHIITLLPEFLNKMHLVGKNLEQYSLETVTMFFQDGLKAGFRL